MELETKRLILREFRVDDWHPVFAYQSDARYQRYYTITERTPEQAQEFVQMIFDQQQEIPRRKYQLAALQKTNAKLIGNCDIRMDTAGAHQADIGYEFSPEYWGKGYATEAAGAMVRFGFNTFRPHRIWLW